MGIFNILSHHLLCLIMAHSLIMHPPPLFQFLAHKIVKLNIFCKYLFLTTFASHYFCDIKKTHFCNEMLAYMRIIRTNNDIEGWHCIEVSYKKLKCMQRKCHRNYHGQLFKLWSQYKAGEKNANQILKACSL